VSAGERFPGEQAEIVFTDVFVEYLEDELTVDQRIQVLVEVVGLCINPVGTHPLSNRTRTDELAGWNTLEVLHREHRVVFGSRVFNGVGVIEVLCAGPRREGAAYDIANALIKSGKLTDEEATEIWQAIELLDIVAEQAELDGWDYAPAPAPAGMVKAAVASGLLVESIAEKLSLAELQAALEHGWSGGSPNPAAALNAALLAARSNARRPFDATAIIESRGADRCDVVLPRAKAKCIRRSGHAGPHRSSY
jgi:hypothetical protein